MKTQHPNNNEIMMMVKVENMDDLRAIMLSTFDDWERDEFGSQGWLDAILSHYMTQVLSGELDFETDDFLDQLSSPMANVFDMVEICMYGMRQTSASYYFVSANVIQGTDLVCFTLRKGTPNEPCKSL